MIVLKKSAPGKPPRRSMCIDYRRIKKLQPEVTNADGRKGCISLIPLPKIDELYAKLKGYKVFSSLDNSMINVSLMNKLYHVVAHNLNKARKARDGSKKGKTVKEPKELKVVTMYLLEITHQEHSNLNTKISA